jgi:hypothetical protein
MMAYVVQYYFEDMKATGQEPDRKLLGTILPILEKLKRNQARADFKFQG